MRIVSLLAAGTEIVCALGAGDFLVARSHECDYPEWVKRLPAVTSAAFDTSVSSREIDAEVNRRIRAGERLYCVDEQSIAAMAPDLIITQSHCPVCAISHQDITGPVCRLKSTILSLQAGSLAGIDEDIRHIAASLGRADAGRKFIELQHCRRAEISRSLDQFNAPTSVVLEWIDPLFAMGNWGPELMEMAHCRPVMGNRGAHSQAIPFSRLLSADPEVIIIAPCGFSLHRTRTEARVLTEHKDWGRLQAVQRGRVYLADGNRYFNRSGISLTDTVEIMAEILHGQGGANRFHAWEPLVDCVRP